jgi:hypothetical protein
MLPPALGQLKSTLVAKGYANRSNGEDQLLGELESLDSDAEFRDVIDKKSFREVPRITSGSGGCPCCGRS